MGLLLLRAGGVLACLMAALQPTLELRQIVHVPNHVAVLVDTSRSMEVRPPDGGASRAERAAALISGAAPLFAAWEQQGHRVDLYSFGEVLAPTTVAALRRAPAGERHAHRRGAGRGARALRRARSGRGGTLSDGVDTGRIGEGPLDADDARRPRRRWARPSTPWASAKVAARSVGGGRAGRRVRLRAHARSPSRRSSARTGLPDRQIDVTLTRDGRPVATRSVILRGDRSEERVSFDWLPDHPGNFVFQHRDAGADRARPWPATTSQVFTVKVIRDRVRVLHLCGRPSWDQRFLRAMLRRDPNVDLVSFFILRTETDEQPWNRNELSLIPFPTYEIFEEQLRSFDLVIFQNFNFAPYGVEPFLPGVRDYVEGGGAHRR